MAHYEVTVLSPWTAEKAFSYMMDLEHFADWDPGVTKAKRVSGEAPGMGAAYEVTVKSVGGEQTLRYETIAIDSPNRIEVRAETSKLISLDIVTVRPDANGGSRVTYSADLSLKGLLRIGTPVLALMFRGIGDRAAEGLVRVLEGTKA